MGKEGGGSERIGRGREREGRRRDGGREGGREGRREGGREGGREGREGEDREKLKIIASTHIVLMHQSG